MSKEQEYVFELARIGREARAREACPDCGPKIRAERAKKINRNKDLNKNA